MENVELLRLGGFPVVNTSSAGLNELMLARFRAKRRTALLFANSNFLVRCQHLASTFAGPDFVVANDGLAMDIAALLIHHRKFVANLNGTDFVPLLMHSLPAGSKVFLVGSKPQVLETVSAYFEQRLGVSVCGVVDGYSQPHNLPSVVARINEAGAEVVLVALGNPLQEEWIVQYRTQLNAKLLIGVGAFFDFLSGSIPRAPMLLRNLRVEWLYRLSREPTRLAGRYSIGFVRFLSQCYKSR